MDVLDSRKGGQFVKVGGHLSILSISRDCKLKQSWTSSPALPGQRTITPRYNDIS
jgi:hypothetical protein